MSIRVRDKGGSNGVHARKAGIFAVSKLWQLTVIAARKVFGAFPELLLNDMEIVEDPFRCKRHRVAVALRARGIAIHGRQCRAVVLESVRKRPDADGLAANSMHARKGSRELLESFDTEYLAPHRIGSASTRSRSGHS